MAESMQLYAQAACPLLCGSHSFRLKSKLAQLLQLLRMYHHKVQVLEAAAKASNSTAVGAAAAAGAAGAAPGAGAAVPDGGSGRDEAAAAGACAARGGACRRELQPYSIKGSTMRKVESRVLRVKICMAARRGAAAAGQRAGC